LISRRLEGVSHGGVDIFVTPMYQVNGRGLQDRPQGISGERTIRGDKEWLLMESGKKGRHVAPKMRLNNETTIPLTPRVNNENRDNARHTFPVTQKSDTTMSREE